VYVYCVPVAPERRPEKISEKNTGDGHAPSLGSLLQWK
jgi:hypothetical protein